MRYYLGIDIGGTKCAVVICEEANGLIKDKSGARYIGKGVKGGVIVGWGCNNVGILDKTGKITKDNQVLPYKIHLDGGVYDETGKYMGHSVKTGRVLCAESQQISAPSEIGWMLSGKKLRYAPWALSTRSNAPCFLHTSEIPLISAMLPR